MFIYNAVGDVTNCLKSPRGICFSAVSSIFWVWSLPSIEVNSGTPRVLPSKSWVSVPRVRYSSFWLCVNPVPFQNPSVVPGKRFFAVSCYK